MTEIHLQLKWNKSSSSSVLIYSILTVSVSPSSPWFPSCFRYFIDGNKLELHDFFKVWWI